jgi:hypothetical protein
VRSGDATLALRLTVPAGTYWAWRGRREESREAFRAVLAMEGDADPWLRATAHVHRAFSGFEASALADIQSDLARARALYEESGRRPHYGLLSVEPMLEMIDGRAEDAARAAERLTTDPDADD